MAWHLILAEKATTIILQKPSKKSEPEQIFHSIKG